MARKAFDAKLDEIRGELIKLAEVAKEAVGISMESLAKRDTALAKRVSELEERSDFMNLAVEETCLKLTATQQPVARDLRFIATAMRISINFERICDLTEKIAWVGKKPLELPLPEKLLKISEVIQEMLDIDIKAISEKDTSVVNVLQSKDDVIDAIWRGSFREFKRMIAEDPKTVSDAIDYLFVANYLERIGDIAAKTGARVVYMLEGRRVWIK